MIDVLTATLDYLKEISATSYIALTALGLTIWQAQIARGHNRLSVRPILTLAFNEHINVPNGELIKSRLELVVKNLGFGPALIKHIQIKYKDKEVSPYQLSEFLHDRIDEIDGTEVMQAKYGFKLLDKGTLIPSNSSEPYIHVELENLPQAISDQISIQISEIIRGFEFKIIYEDLYKGEHTCVRGKGQPLIVDYS